MSDNKDCVQLSEHCFDVCKVLKTVIQGNNADNLDESVKMALGGLERCVDEPHPRLLSAKLLQGGMRNRADAQEWGGRSTPGI